MRSDWYLRSIHILNHVALFVGLGAIAFGQLSPWFLVVGVAAFLLAGMVGANVALHRFITHRSFKTTPLKATLLKYLTLWTGQGPPIAWAWVHRYHHKHADTDLDLHSPYRMSTWRAYFAVWPQKELPTSMIRDLVVDRDLRWLNENYFRLWARIAVLIFAFSWTVSALAGLPFLSAMGFGFGMMTFLWLMPAVGCFHGVGVLGSFAHIWGDKLPGSKDEARNSGVNTILSLGEGWHANHHRWPGAYRQGTSRWQFDPPAWIIERFFKV